jgi:hypothetical protein
MEPVEFREAMTIIAKNQPEYMALPAYEYEDDPCGRTVFCWKLTWKERFRLLRTGLLWHQVLTFEKPLQPQRLQVDKPVMPRIKL